ncbi:hypothetical protein [Burkholderia pseudomallei]|uniref:hypothetical protein n=1 Tax=Burkholderia pseudomallei TaxID=28450 RepID=UPI001E3A2987|nr:hypothetical protein [Burkholderia pseudomallei]
MSQLPIRFGSSWRDRADSHGRGDAGRRATPPPPRAPSRAVARRRSDDVACGRILPRLGARVGRSAEHRDRGVSRSDAAPRFPRGPCNAARAVRLKAVRAPVSNGSKPPQAGAARSARGARPGCPARANRVFAAPCRRRSDPREPRAQATRRGRRPDIAPPLAGSFNPLGGRERTPFPAIVDDKFWPVRAFVAAIPYSSILTKQLHSMERGCLMTSV